MNPHIREWFVRNPNHTDLLNDMNYLNTSFIDIIDTVCGYRIELGTSLQKLIESYNAVYLHQFHHFYSSKLERELDLDKKIAEHEKEISILKQKERDIDEDRELRIKLLASKDQDIA